MTQFSIYNSFVGSRFISQRMSSIISDIFYGSKQNLLDNYLINRFEKEPSLSIPQHKTAIYSSSLQFEIIIPLAKGEGQKYYQISVQLGKRMDQIIVSIGGNTQPSEIVLSLSDLDSLDLSLYSNIKITISEGKYKNKVFGYIPIETIKSLISHQSGEKTIVLPMKGKHFIGFNSIKCTIKGQFIQNNILNSNILASVDKDNSQLSHFNTKNRQNGIQDMSQIQNPSQNTKNTKPGVKRQYVKNANYRKSSQQFNQYDRNNFKDFKMGSGLSKKPKATTQYIREVTTVAIIFSTIKINKQKEIQGGISLKHGDLTIVIGQETLLNNLTKEGFNIEVQQDGTKLGLVHLNALFLTMEDFKGELPIYGQNQQFIGTILVCSPSAFVAKNVSTWNKEFIGKRQNSEQINQQLGKQTVLPHSSQFKELLILKIQKIIMTNTQNQLNNESVQNIDRQKLQLFDFIKMEAQGRLELIIRVNNQTYKFNDISIRYIIDCGQIQVVQFKRRQEFIIHSFQPNAQKNNIIQIELYSNHRLLCYSKSSICHQNMASHHFVAAQTNFRYCQCALYLKFIDLQVHEDYFQQSRIKYIIDILEKLLKSQIQITDLSDEGIKRIMNVSKKIAYVEVKKLFTLIHKQFQRFVAFQKTKVESVFKNEFDKNQLIAKVNAKLLRQFALIDFNGESAIQASQFDSVIQFFSGEEQEQAKKEYELLVSYCIKTKENKILYPLFIAGLYLIQQPSYSGFRPQQISNSSTQQLQDYVEHQKQTVKQIEILTQQLCFIQKISFSNLHLLNLGKIPNVVLNIAKKVHYSNANPQFIIQKQINLMQPIKIYHKNISLNDLTLLGEFQAVKRRSLYQIDISGKATVKIIWGH